MELEIVKINKIKKEPILIKIHKLYNLNKKLKFIQIKIIKPLIKIHTN